MAKALSHSENGYLGCHSFSVASLPNKWFVEWFLSISIPQVAEEDELHGHADDNTQSDYSSQRNPHNGLNVQRQQPFHILSLRMQIIIHFWLSLFPKSCFCQSPFLRLQMKTNFTGTPMTTHSIITVTRGIITMGGMYNINTPLTFSGCRLSFIFGCVSSLKVVSANLHCSGCRRRRTSRARR